MTHHRQSVTRVLTPKRHAGRETAHEQPSMCVQTFCTSSRRPETGRARRRLGARPSCRCAWAGHATRPPAGVQTTDRAAAMTRALTGRLFEVNQLTTGAAWEPGHGMTTRILGGPVPESSARSVPGRPSEVKGASHRTRRPCGPPLTSEPLRPSGRCSEGRPGACPHQVAHRRPRHRLRTQRVCQVSIDVRAGRVSHAR
jgi:hypothetical protein